MRSNHDIVLLDGRIDSGLPGWAFGMAQFAIVGLGVDRVPDDRYERLVLQVTGADRFFGVSPVKDVSWPARPSPRTEQRYSVLLNPDARQRWRDRTEGVSVVCSYARQFPLHRYRFELAFAPVIEFIANSPLTLDDWVTRWLQPLVDVASLASGDPQRLAWLTVHSGTGREETSGVVFGGGIAQAPYQAGYDDEWRRSGRRPLFTFTTLPVPLPVLLRRWRRLGSGDSPFVALYRLALLDPDLPLRARYLYLIQALEALHGYENRAKEDKAQRSFAANRKKVIAEIEGLGADPSRVSFLKDNWSTRKQISLASRLSDLVKRLPAPVQGYLKRPEMAPIAEELRTQDKATVLHEQLGVLRNDLSHGRHNYPDTDLKPWVESVDLICRAPSPAPTRVRRGRGRGGPGLGPGFQARLTGGPR
jgi:hypothetical protein